MEVIGAAARGGADSAPLVRWPQWIVLGTTVAAVLLPNSREWLTNASELYLRMMRYLWRASTRNRLTGQLQDLVDRINRQPDVENIHLMGFSFGSLVILDTVYPADSSHPATIQQVRTISTIGCPFDLVRMLQPQYAEERAESTDSTPYWVNVFSPIDVFASNFRDDNEHKPDKPPEQGLTVDRTIRTPNTSIAWNAQTKLNLVNILMLLSIRVHGQYWDLHAGSRTALGPVVSELFGGSSTLR